MADFRQVLKRWLPAILIMSVIYWISSWPGQTIKDAGLGGEGIHVNGHFVLYFLLCMSFFKATKNILLSALLAFVYGLTDEYHQSFVPERSSSLKDIIVNSSGIMVAVFVLWKFEHFLPQKLRNWLHN